MFSPKDTLAPKDALEAIRTQIVQKGCLATFCNGLTSLAEHGSVSAQDLAEVLEECHIEARTILLRRIISYLAPNAKVEPGNNETRISLEVVLKAVNIPQGRRGSDPSINYADLYNQSRRFNTGTETVELEKEDEIMENVDITLDAVYTPDESMHPVQALQRIATKLVLTGKMQDLQDHLMMADAKKTGSCSVQDFADALEDCDVWTRTLLVRRIFQHFDAEADPTGEARLPITRLLSLIAEGAQKPAAKPQHWSSDEDQELSSDEEEKQPTRRAPAKEPERREGGVASPHSVGDDMSPQDALVAIRTRLAESDSMEEFCEALDMLDSGKGLVSVQDFAEALEDVHIVVRTGVLRGIHNHLGANPEDELLLLNRKLLLGVLNRS